jgi:hypothetical protein
LTHAKVFCVVDRVLRNRHNFALSNFVADGEFNGNFSTVCVPNCFTKAGPLVATAYSIDSQNNRLSACNADASQAANGD